MSWKQKKKKKSCGKTNYRISQYSLRYHGTDVELTCRLQIADFVSIPYLLDECFLMWIFIINFITQLCNKGK